MSALSDITQAAADLQTGVPQPGLPDGERHDPTAATHQWHRQDPRFSGAFVRDTRDPKPLLQLQQRHAGVAESAHQYHPEQRPSSKPNWTGRMPTRTGRSIQRLEPGLQENTTALRPRRSRTGCHCTPKLISTTKTPPARRICVSTPRRATKTSGNSSTRLGCNTASRPELYKSGESWNFYDQPLVANYGGFYRLPLGNGPIQWTRSVARQPAISATMRPSANSACPPSSGRPGAERLCQPLDH